MFKAPEPVKARPETSPPAGGDRGPMNVILVPLLQLLDVVLELYQIVLIVWVVFLTSTVGPDSGRSPVWRFQRRQ